jgi:hypothetical protein
MTVPSVPSVSVPSVPSVSVLSVPSVSVLSVDSVSVSVSVYSGLTGLISRLTPSINLGVLKFISRPIGHRDSRM